MKGLFQNQNIIFLINQIIILLFTTKYPEVSTFLET